MTFDRTQDTHYAPKVTVYMPCYNYAAYVGEAIESVIAQTFEDWELIVINDGSIDGTKEALLPYEGRERIEVIHQENKGLNVTNNIALRAAQGEYIVRLDADDYLHPHAIASLVDCLDRNSDVGLVFPDYYEVDKNGRILRMVKTAIQDPTIEQLRDRPAHGACTMFRRSVLIRIGGYSEKYRRQDGYDIWLKVIGQFKPMSVDLPLFYYRQHGKSITDNMPKLLGTRREIVADHAARKAVKLQTVALIPVGEHTLYEKADPLSLLNGKRLVDYTLEAAQNSPSIQKIIVSTNHSSLVEYLEENHPEIQTVPRPESLAGNQSHLFEKLVKYHFELLEEQGQSADVMCILPVNAPLRRSEHIDWAVNSMKLFDTDIVYAIEEDPSQFYTHSEKGMRALNQGEGLRIERESLYRDTGVLYLYHRNASDRIEDETCLRGHITLLPSESIRINSDFEFRLSELILQGAFE